MESENEKENNVSTDLSCPWICRLRRWCCPLVGMEITERQHCVRSNFPWKGMGEVDRTLLGFEVQREGEQIPSFEAE